ncbi:MAG: cation diffusion facilitator family transporter [Gammaproteobacteria bacterium]|nr:cation diffusion facilitator family transporter [Gammaproteobacteria bacterium]MDH5275309.1 cation diffusion facilitator family transporter [Gammaproteobacteria bacterium]
MMTTARKTNALRRATLLRSATYASVGVAVCLVLVKTWAWRATDSVSILSSLADSFLDVLASLLTFWAVRYSLRPPDHEHRFGHGKAEGLAALLQALIISGSGVFVGSEAVNRLISPTPIEQPVAGIAVIVASTIITLALVYWQRYVSLETGSVAIAADAMHYKTDLALNLGVVAGVAMAAYTGQRWVDPLVGLGVAVFLVQGAWRIAAKSLDILLDREIPSADRDRIRDLATRHAKVLGFHDLRTRHGGSGYIVQFHLELEPRTSLVETHRILDEVEYWIEKAYPGCEIIIHPDPLGFEERRDHFEKADETTAQLS